MTLMITLDCLNKGLSYHIRKRKLLIYINKSTRCNNHD